MKIRTLLSALFTPTIHAERDSLKLHCASLRATLERKDCQVADLADRLQKMSLVAKHAINRAEAAEAQLADIHGRVDSMALVYPWLNEERKAATNA
jgi:hypothetical protein